MRKDNDGLDTFVAEQEGAFRLREAFRQTMHEAFRRVIELPDYEPALGRFRHAYEYRRSHYLGAPEAENQPGQRSADRDGLRAALERALSLALFDNLDKSDDPDLVGSTPLDARFKQELAMAAKSIVTNDPWRRDMLRMGDYFDALCQHDTDTTNPAELSALIAKGLNRYCDRAIEPDNKTAWRIEPRS